MNKRGKDKCLSQYNFFPKNRRGSHVEVIISFIIFITFVVFLLAAVKPSITKQENKKNMFEEIQFKIMDDTYVDMTSITVTIPSGGGNCFNLDNLISELNIGKNIIVRNSSGKKVPQVNSNGNSIQIDRGNAADTFFKIYYSPEFGSLVEGSGCPIIVPEIGITKTTKYISEQQVRDLVIENYETVKIRLGIPEEVDFGYGIALSNRTIIVETAKNNLSTNIYVRETPIEYINLNGEVLPGFLRITLW